MSENTIFKLNVIGIDYIKYTIQFSFHNGDELLKAYELLNTGRWETVNRVGYTITAVSTFPQYEELIITLTDIGVYNITECLDFTTNWQGNIKQVTDIIEGDQWDSFTMDRQLVNTVYGKMPIDTWYISAKRCLTVE